MTIPVAVLERVGVAPGDELRVEADDAGRILLEPSLSRGDRRREAIERSKGALSDVYEPGYLDRLRDEWR